MATTPTPTRRIRHQIAAAASASPAHAERGRRRWPLERILFLMAGTMTGLS